MKTTEDLAKEYGLALNVADGNGYARSVEQFEYKTADGYVGYSRNFSLVIERHVKGTHKLLSLNDIPVTL